MFVLSRSTHVRNPCRFAFIQEPHLKLPFSDLATFMVKLAFLGVQNLVPRLGIRTDNEQDALIEGLT
jgi:hypothetical protein